MKEIGNFLVEYWKEILLGVCAVISLVITIIRRRVKVSFTDIFEYIHKIFDLVGLDLIQEAEESFSEGFNKKSFVISRCMKLLEKCCEIDDKQRSKAEAEFGRLIESVLSCPTKKV